jgi:hypothetical protein
MRAELNEHRYYLEWNVERRTEQLLKRTELLEYCNATLCDKLALARKELVALKQELARTLLINDAKPNERAMKLYVMSNQTPGSIGTNVQERWGEQATAA